MSTDQAMWGAARALWPAAVSRDPDLRDPQLAAQMAITRAFVAEHLVKSQTATVGLSVVKVVSEAIAGQWVSQTCVLAALMAAGYRTRVGRRGEVTVYARPRDLWLIRALRRGFIPPHHQISAEARS